MSTPPVGIRFVYLFLVPGQTTNYVFLISPHCVPLLSTLAWAPHSSCHICTAGEDKQALIWDLTAIAKRPIEDPILAYNAEGEVNNLQWSASQPDWVSIAFDNKLQILRV